ncbi:MAG TPA: hypothetical protein VIL85_25470 [Thermomicrobiales bacterium]|jgi:hypothetical protein
MTVNTSPDDHTTTATLQARLAQVERTLARYEAERGQRHNLPTGRKRRGGRWAGAVAALLIALVPLSILGAGPTFNDLGTAGVEHQGDIQAIAAVGITTGLDDPKSSDPNQRLYDPKGTVTREQMASFLARTAGLGTNTPIVNAASALKLATDPTGETAFAANELTRIAAFNSGDDFFLTAPASTPPARDIHTLTLDVPVQSYVLFQFTGYMIAKQGASCPCELRGSARMDDGTKVILTSSNLGTEGSNYVGTFDRRSVAGSYVFLATPGSHTFTLSIDRGSGGTLEIGLAAPAIQAIALPFGPTGDSATTVPGGASGQGNASSTSQP